MAYARIFSIVIHKLSHWQKTGLIILLKINKGLEVSLHNTVLPLCLAIYLKVESCQKLLFDVEEIAE